MTAAKSVGPWTLFTLRETAKHNARGRPGKPKSCWAQILCRELMLTGWLEWRDGGLWVTASGRDVASKGDGR